MNLIIVAKYLIQPFQLLHPCLHHLNISKERMKLCVQSLKVQITSRMTKDLFNKLKVPKAECIHSLFLPGLQGVIMNGLLNNTNMGTTNPTQAIFLRVIPKEIEEKVNKQLIILDKINCFVWGLQDYKWTQIKGSDLSIDVPYDYSRFFLEDDIRLQEIRDLYGKSIMMTSEIKKELITVFTKIVKVHQWELL
ncbi:unnamed protein product [Paramecium primaurelia]|uniref:Uncharacterized protein n=1 Tax=Paramecium primaurelia TaxID=5886 RepID=A0A8S1JQN8_PARPR|nr:unnamed protein product [Paramecium primaurelia]